jgi:hypothetical protein
VKVVPAEGHLRELRAASLAQSGVEDAFRRHFSAVRSLRVCYAHPVTAADYPALEVMSPLTAHRAADVRARLEASGCAAVTVDLVVLAGRLDWSTDPQLAIR